MPGSLPNKPCYLLLIVRGCLFDEGVFGELLAGTVVDTHDIFNLQSAGV